MYRVLVLADTLAFRGEPEAGKDRSQMLSVRSTAKGSNRIRLGLLPVLEPRPRTANVIAYEGHDVWSHLQNEEHATAYLEKMFPQIDWSTALPEGELARFVASKGGRFPAPQMPRNLAWTGRDDAALLIGDAAHAFPPDLGQGVNSALEDALVLDDAFEEAMRKTDNGDASAIARDAAKRYATKREPDARALVHLVAHGYPWQYAQPGFVAQLRAKLWALNFLLRSALNKVLPAVFGPACFLDVQLNTDKAYRTIWRRAQATTARIVALFAALVAWVAWALSKGVAAAT